MVRRLVLLIPILVLLLPAVAATAGGCTGAGAISGCINNGGVDVHGEVDVPGSGGGNGGGSGSGGGGGGSSDGPPVIWKCMEVRCGEDEPGAQPITLSDIARFRPTPGVQHMQPDGWTVPGLDTNFYAVTSTHVVEGTLLGEDAAVRFTPVGFHWSYGDGTSATRSTKGGTWSELGLREFDRTPTSHVYEREQRYTIRLVIDFAAAYRFDGSAWVPIPGVLPVPANDLHTTVDGAKTVLVERHCTEDPSGPGC